jgi:hypothetical protein
MNSKVHLRLFTTSVKEVDFLSFLVHFSDMKTRQLSMFAWLLGAVMAAATLASCSTQGQQTCSAYQQVQPAAQPSR